MYKQIASNKRKSIALLFGTVLHTGALGAVLTEQAAPYYIAEEEIPRAGTTVGRSFQRARWLNGTTYLWIGRDRAAGKGEGWSNLRFDRIVDIRQNLR